MNTPSTTISPLRKFGWLLRREYWENRGGFFWAPVITAIIVSVLGVLGTIASVLLVNRLEDKSKPFLQMGKSSLHANSSISDPSVLGAVGDGSLLSGIAIIALVLAFSVFFYSLGALYDDRRDRSILFWKSLPVSDALTIVSKSLWALLLAPALAIATGLALGVVMVLLGVLNMKLIGVPGGGAMLWNTHYFRVALNALSVVPVYAAWALPAVGWLMLCSAAARSKPFLWAVLVPILSATLLSWLGALPGISMPHGTIWYVLGYRLLLSVAPGTWYIDETLIGRLAASADSIESPQDLVHLVDPSRSWHLFAGTDVWIGMAAGLAMIALAVWLRRRRDEA